MKNIKRRSINSLQSVERPKERNNDAASKKDPLATHMEILAMQNDKDKNVKETAKIPPNATKQSLLQMVKARKIMENLI